MASETAQFCYLLPKSQKKKNSSRVKGKKITACLLDVVEIRNHVTHTSQTSDIYMHASDRLYGEQSSTTEKADTKT